MNPRPPKEKKIVINGKALQALPLSQALPSSQASSPAPIPRWGPPRISATDVITTDIYEVCLRTPLTRPNFAGSIASYSPPRPTRARRRPRQRPRRVSVPLTVRHRVTRPCVFLLLDGCADYIFPRRHAPRIVACLSATQILRGVLSGWRLRRPTLFSVRGLPTPTIALRLSTSSRLVTELTVC